MTEILIRFLIGGAVVSAFAVLGDLFKPKSFAGLFGAAPSVALATLGLTIMTQGAPYAAIEASSMLPGAIGLLAYASCVSRIMMHYQYSALVVTTCSIPLWFAVTFGLWHIWLR